MNAEQSLVRFAHDLQLEDVPDEVVFRMKCSILDVLAAALAGTAAEGIGPLVEVVTGWGGAPEASIFGYQTRVPVPLAALANATIARALELDDVHEKALLHPTVSVVPLALGISEARGGVSGREFLASVIAAEEITCRLGLSPEYYVAGDKHQPRGWSYTYQCGILGGTIAAARLLGLDEDSLLSAVGNAYSSLAGNQQAVQEGVLAIRVQQGLCAQTAAQSAYLALAGLSGPHGFLEGMFGWLSFWQGGRYDRAILLDDLGRRWEVGNISLKYYPCCKLMHTTVAALCEAMGKVDFRPHDVRRATVHVASQESWDEVVQPVEQRRRPKNAIQAQFSLPYVAAVTLVRGTVSLDDFAPDALGNPDVLNMAQRVEPVMDDAQGVLLGRALPVPSEVEIELNDGRVVAGKCELPRGHPDNPMSWEEVRAKLLDCASWARRYERGRTEAIAHAVAELEQLQDMTELSRLLS
ncbi:MAG: MmgE/PrpD family protein [Chloroflexota bacterium]|nr:MmgE/PrpD family protein [Chloroflexota bacterium]